MGEHLRALHRALKSVGHDPSVCDVYGTDTPDSDLRKEFDGCLSPKPNGKVNIFCLNGDEVEPCLRHLQTDLSGSSVNIIYPAWELSRYPQEWAAQLNRFDEVWAASTFTAEAFKASVMAPVFHLPLPGEVRLSRLFGRRYFGIPEDAFVFLFFFDFSSYVTRKNPRAVLTAFRELYSMRPNNNACLVMKIKGLEHDPLQHEQLVQELSRVEGRLVVIDRILDDAEVKSLLYISDCFVSLHRAEGFGFGLIWAMYLGKPVIATNYSGNIDYMNDINSYLVPFVLKEVGPGEYPFYSHQQWAEPNIISAVNSMCALLDNQVQARLVGTIANRYIRTHFSYRACGLRFQERIEKTYFDNK